jgi:DHA1 family bicyclomycin/chloramphenicol resistance-like MFS transporter
MTEGVEPLFVVTRPGLARAPAGRIVGLSPQAYSLVFAANGVGIVAASYLSRSLIGRLRPAQLVHAGVAIAAVGAALLLVTVLLEAPVGFVLPPLFLVVSPVGLVGPNATALALADHPSIAGAASALLGVAQFLIGAVAAPLVGSPGPAARCRWAPRSWRWSSPPPAPLGSRP